MLVLTRKQEQEIIIGDARVKVVSIARGRVKLGIVAPEGVPIMRTELLSRPKQQAQQDSPS